MAGSKKRTTMAKLNRESRLRERREEKEARKVARKLAADAPPEPDTEPAVDDEYEPAAVSE